MRCPWRIANQGKPHPHGWYTKTNLRRLWAGLRTGEDMTCHPTDPDNPVPEGHEAAPPGAQTIECAGALILKQREAMRFQAIIQAADPDPLAVYRRQHPRGLTKAGLTAIVSRHLFGGTPLSGPRMATPNLDEDGIGAPDVHPWVSGECR